MITKILIPVILSAGIIAWNLPQEGALKESMKRGEPLYLANCLSCHQPKGEGVEGSFPPLIKNSFVKDAKVSIGIILNGQSGEVTVNGKKYNTPMPKQDYLSDEQIADILNYVRNNWGNKNALITPAQVKAERK